ncbi:hypothetical protein DT076_07725 [Desertihabitans brevis]|uniref:ATP-binding protein n=1 Tax=Desertihabitans brevis TaxID=2268447 RepID=A0A367YVZ1_9ACTN|nr:hypothetical protein [Desertihabitans brevis]RCK69907.1 hypothetical protein DT076_07725 [Desertihabitans brevis]
MRPQLYETRGDRPPPLLVGHDDRLRAWQHRLSDLRARGRAGADDVVLTASRGGGKSALLHWMAELARQQDVKVIRISGERLTESLAAACQALEEGKRGRRRWRLSGQDLSARLNLGVFTASAGVRTELREQELTRSPVQMAASLDALAAGRRRRDRGGLVVLVDDLHRATPEELRFLDATLSQLDRAHGQAPVTLVGAGDPSVWDRLRGDAERGVVDPEGVLRFDHLAPQLSPQDAYHAVAYPAHQLGVHWEPEAVRMVLQASEGHPAALQRYARGVWEQGHGLEPVTVEHAARGIAAVVDEHAVETSRRVAGLDDRQLDYLAAVCARGGTTTSADVRATLGSAGDPDAVRDALLGAGHLHRTRSGALTLANPADRRFVLELHARAVRERPPEVTAEPAGQRSVLGSALHSLRRITFPGAARRELDGSGTTTGDGTRRGARIRLPRRPGDRGVDR